MPVVFDACYQVLIADVRAYHYVELTEAAFELIGADKAHVHWKKQIEDVREKLAGKPGRREKWGTIRYTWDPLCMVVLSSWLPPGAQSLLCNEDPPIIVRANAAASIRATFEALMRAPHMIQKTNASPEAVAMGRARGLQIEHAISSWFKDRWPMFYREPDNYDRFNAWCSHDFKLDVEGRVMLVDVAGPDSSGLYRNPGSGKKPVDLHVLGNVAGDHFVIDGLVTGKEYGARERKPIPLSSMMSAQRLAFFLNCRKLGHDHARIIADATRQEAA